MKEIKIHKAELLGNTEPQPVTIIIDSDLSPEPGIIGDLENTFAYDAQELARALFSSLPQGTMDRLLMQLMKRKISVYRGITIS